MAKDKEAGVYRIVDAIAVSSVSWEDAAKRAVETAGKSLRDLRIAEASRWT
jgi:flavin-binding protein dodecin